MKQFARLNYEEFIINGEVNERLPLYNEQIYNVYPLDEDINGIYPDCKIENGNISIGDSSLMVSKSNVTLTNGIMQFTGNSNSYVELHRDIMDMEELELEFNFKVTDLSSDSTLFSSSDLTIKVNSASKYIYAEMPNLVGKYTPKPDLSNGAFRFTTDNSIRLNTWHRLKIFKYKTIVSVIFEHDVTKSLVCESGFAPTVSYLGKGLKGQIKNMSVWKRKEFSNEISISIPSSYTATGIINAKSSSVYDILNIGTLRVKLNNNNLVISNGSTNVLNASITIGRNYGLVCAFANNSMKVFVRDYKTDAILVNTDISISYSNTATVNTNGTLRNLSIYKVKLSNEKVSELNKKKFSLNKEGDILYQLDEVSGHDKLKITNGRKYHLQLTRDLNSDCGTITNNANVEFVNGGVESRLDNRKVKLLFANKISLSNTWDIIYRTKITGLTNGKHYDSLGEGLYWGIEDNKFVIKYINGQSIVSSFIDGLIANEVLNEWLIISVTYSSNKATLFLGTSKGVFSTSITKAISSITNSYDLFLGGKEDDLYGQAIYRELTIVNGWNVNSLYKENMFRTKFSYYNNKLISNVQIVENIM
nr:MAG TPA: hypothetical protein [Caudoviricetes sp.]